MSTSPDTTSLRRAIGQRLAEERVGLKLNQDELGQIVGKSRRAISAWEAGDQTPDAEALALADARGMDVLYVVTGRRGAVLSTAQQLLVTYTRNVPEQAMNAVLLTARTIGSYAAGLDPETISSRAEAEASKPPQANVQEPTTSMTFHAEVGNAAGRDINTGSNRSPVLKRMVSKKPRSVG